MGMSEQQDRRTLEREEIAERVASFKATQEKFRREREEYCVTTLENARHSENTRHAFERPPFWS
jgi:chorismate mutase